MKMIELLEKNGYDLICFMGEWKEYKVYLFSTSDIFNKGINTGMPVYYLISDKEERFATEEEIQKIIASWPE